MAWTVHIVERDMDSIGSDPCWRRSPEAGISPGYLFGRILGGIWNVVQRGGAR
jgi:hypothetical protein